MEEYDPKFEYIKGELHVTADTFLRIRKKNAIELLVGKNNAPMSDIKDYLADDNILTILYNDQEYIDCFQDEFDYKSNLLEFIKDNDWYLNLSKLEI